MVRGRQGVAIVRPKRPPRSHRLVVDLSYDPSPYRHGSRIVASMSAAGSGHGRLLVEAGLIGSGGKKDFSPVRARHHSERTERGMSLDNGLLAGKCQPTPRQSPSVGRGRRTIRWTRIGRRQPSSSSHHGNTHHSDMLSLGECSSEWWLHGIASRGTLV